jgi:hypothetical protein
MFTILSIILYLFYISSLSSFNMHNSLYFYSLSDYFAERSFNLKLNNFSKIIFSFSYSSFYLINYEFKLLILLIIFSLFLLEFTKDLSPLSNFCFSPFLRQGNNEGAKACESCTIEQPLEKDFS